MNKPRLKIVVVIFLLLIISSLLAKEQFVVRINDFTELDVKKFVKANYDIASIKPGEYLDLVVDNSLYKKLKNQGYRLNITQTEQQLKDNLKTDKDIPGYRNYDEVVDELFEIVADNPNICQVVDIGDSWGKIYSDDEYDDYEHEVWALKLSDNPQQNEDEPAVYYIGEHHAREPISLEVVMAILHHLLDNYGSDSEITENINNTEIWFVPLINPDGHKIVIDQTDIWWRKNIRDNNDNNNLDYLDGVDPNRNYSWEWGNVGASDDWEEDIYHGPEPFSEPEIQAIRDFMNDKNFVAGISYHSYSELVLFPFGYSQSADPPDKDAMEALAIEMAETIPADGGGHYTPQQAWELYACQGTSDDYLYGELGIFAYTIELATEFIPPANEVDDICENNIDAGLILLDRVNKSTLTGHIVDNDTNEPISAQIYVEGIDNTGVYRKPYTSEEDYGRYYRLLPEGNYDVTFSAYGYETVSENVDINTEGQTNLDIELQSVPFYGMHGFVRDEAANEPVQYATVEILNTPLDTQISNEDGIFYFDEIAEGEYDVKISAENYQSVIKNVQITNDNNIYLFNLGETIAFSFEDGVLEPEWENSGHDDWGLNSATAYDGAYSVKSGNIANTQFSALSLEVDFNNATEVSFFKKVSSESGYDFLKFLIDNQVQDQWAGEVDWSESNFEVSAGSHTLTWKYEKDIYVSEGQDCAWLDYVILPLEEDYNFNPPQNLTLETYEADNNQYFELNWENPADTGDGNLTAYKIYRNFAYLDQVSDSVITYSDENAPMYADDYVHYYVKAVYQNPEGESPPSNLASASTNTYNSQDVIPIQTRLQDNYPNPFNPETTISFLADKGKKAVVEIFNIKGQKIHVLQKNNIKNGLNKMVWDGSDVAGNEVSSGLYLYKLSIDGKIIGTDKMMLLK